MSRLTSKKLVWRCLISVSAREDEYIKMISAIFVPGKTFFPAELRLYRIPKINDSLAGMVGKSTSGSADLGLHGTNSGFHGGLSSFK
jgi:hypothetical protein